MEIVGLFLDLLFHPHSGDMLRMITGRKKYLLVKDKDNRLVCCCIVFSDQTESEDKKIVEEYLKTRGLGLNSFDFETKIIKNKDEQLKKILPYRVSLLDGELVLFRDVEEKAQEYVIKGYNGKLPTTYKMYRYTTLTKK